MIAYLITLAALSLVCLTLWLLLDPDPGASLYYLAREWRLDVLWLRFVAWWERLTIDTILKHDKMSRNRTL